jgi:hypothetical protein
MAVAPVESSSVVLNSTNGIEMPMELISVKESKAGSFVQVVPEYRRLKNKYQLMWDQKDCLDYLKTSEPSTAVEAEDYRYEEKLVLGQLESCNEKLQKLGNEHPELRAISLEKLRETLFDIEGLFTPIFLARYRRPGNNNALARYEMNLKF